MSHANPQTSFHFYYSSQRNPKLSFYQRRLLLLLRYIFLLIPFCYISGFIMCIGPFAHFGSHQSTLPPGSVYQSHLLFTNLWPHIYSDNSSALQLSSIWRYHRKPKLQKPCPNTLAALRRNAPAFSGYLIVDANGGLNQQRSAICNAVAVAGLLNAILVIPRLEFHSVWRDPSEFGDIYDVNHFIATLKGHVHIVEKLPAPMMEFYNGSISNIRNMRVQAWAPVSYYLEQVYPRLRKRGVIRIAPFANRLAMTVPPEIQYLRCLANFKALKFSHQILELSKKIRRRMIRESPKADGKYIAIHLRFEEDMVAFSCCLYDEDETSKRDLESIRKNTWGNKFKRKDSVIRPDLNRMDGKCPLSPLETGMMLRGMGFNNNTSIYLASGNIYNAAKHLAPLRTMFPLLYTKESLTTPDEIASFKEYSSRLAALDYMVALHSEVFVTTQGGNFPQFLMGQRRFLFGGHAKTIKPDKQKLVMTFDNTEISWIAFKNQMEAMLIESDRQGILVPKAMNASKLVSIYSNPFPDCRCMIKPHSTFKLMKPIFVNKMDFFFKLNHACAFLCIFILLIFDACMETETYTGIRTNMDNVYKLTSFGYFLGKNTKIGCILSPLANLRALLSIICN
uniref:O-fucosyltransferase family protein n=1 Tax=Kalanchoe fedtschenkoi TaxID=63787 RepID=A0A7N0TCB8_KALFE